MLTEKTQTLFEVFEKDRTDQTDFHNNKLRQSPSKKRGMAIMRHEEVLISTSFLENIQIIGKCYDFVGGFTISREDAQQSS